VPTASKQKNSAIPVQRVTRPKQNSSTIDVITTPDLRNSPDLSRLGAHACLVARDAVTNLAEGLSTRSSLAFLSVKECESELDEIDRYVDERIADELSAATPDKVKELLACLKFVLDLERIGDLVLTIVGRARAYADRLSNDDRNDLHAMCQTLGKMLTLVHEANAARNVQPARTAHRLDGEMDRLRTRIYSRQINRRKRDLALSLEVFSMAQALERAGDHAKNLAEEVCHLVEGRTMRHQRA
jgi:phosphate transport system protein